MILTVTMNPAIDKIYLIDNYTLGEVHRPKEVIASPGGKGLNVARVAKLMGEDVTATGLLGGSTGMFIDKGVKELGIYSAFANVVGETRICINVTDEKSMSCTEVLEPGPTITEKEASRFLEVFEDFVKKSMVITISGSLPRGLTQDFYYDLILLCHKHNKKVLLDSSGIAFKEGLKAKPYLIKPNKDEIKQVYHKEISNENDVCEAISYFKELGITIPVISMGKDGSMVGLLDGIYHFSLPSINVINTVGSGDSFIAGCATGIHRGFELVDVIKLATACGTANTQFSQTGFVTKELVENYYKKVKVERITKY